MGNSSGWGGGYFLGWANGTYSEETSWLVDDITISNQSLVIGDEVPVKAAASAPSPFEARVLDQ